MADQAKTAADTKAPRTANRVAAERECEGTRWRCMTSQGKGDSPDAVEIMTGRWGQTKAEERWRFWDPACSFPEASGTLDETGEETRAHRATIRAGRKLSFSAAQLPGRFPSIMVVTVRELGAQREASWP